MAGLVQEEIVGVQDLVAQELKNRSMEGVAARFCNHADVGATITTIGCVVQPCLDLEFLNAVGARDWNSAAPCRTALHIAHANAVQLEVIVIGARSMDEYPIVGAGDLGQCRAPQSKPSCVVDAGNNPR